MKPIQLTWSGLQSYREKQEIDFTLLCDAGVFGIFGPTGSGKSTILDAITLALYGKVERASNGTQGILNQAENILTVSFTFELSHAEGSRKFRVDRQYKRAADVSITNTICRLIQINSTHESIVIADKAGEVNARILQILGLSMQDFSRAVILPQGKFAEFLSLKGTDRRQMLQRLFHLEHYGDVLNAKVSQRTKETDVAIKQIAAEQLGLGDASEQALTQTKRLLDEADLLAKQKRLELQQVTRQWDEMKQLRGLQQEKLEIEAQQTSHLREEPRIVQQEQKLRAADQAERVRHFLREFEETQLQSQTLDQQKEQMTLQHTELALQTEKVAQLHLVAKHELTTQDAPLQVKLEQLKQAILVEQAIQKGQQLEDELAEKLAYCKQQADQSQAELVKKQDTHARALKKQAELQEQVKAMEIKTDHRQRLQNALRDKQVQDTIQIKVQDILKQTAAKQQQLESETQRKAELTNQLDNSQDELVAFLQTVQGNARIQALMEAGLNELVIKAQGGIEAVKKAEKAADIARHAFHLAGQLQEHQPCPVCGSSDHPAPLINLIVEDASTAVEGSMLERYELLLAKVYKLQINQERQAMQGQDLQQKLTDTLSDLTSLELAEMEVAAALASNRLITASTIDELENAYESLFQQIKQVGQQQSGIAEKIQLAFQLREQIYQQQMVVLAQLQALQSTIEGLELESITAVNLYKQQVQNWQITYPTLSLESIQLESDKLNEQDSLGEQLRLRVEQSIPFIEELIIKIQQNLLEATALDKQKIQLEAEFNGQRKMNIELINQFKTRWEHEIKANSSIAEHIQLTEQHLKRLREAERQAMEKLEQSQRELMQLNETFISLRQAADSAKQAFRKAKQFWEEALEQTTFRSAEEVKSALLSKREIDEWQNEVNQHREQQAGFKTKLTELAIKLNHRSIDENQWSDLELSLKSVKTMDEQALQERAKIERDLEQLQSKHQHWIELEQNLFNRKQELTDLNKLQSVLRGNAFVEYIAEEQLIQVCRSASERLGQLTRQRYALEVDSNGGFVIRDDANGGVRRPVSTLSGGETFLTSLALALALSAQIQLSGQYPLEFFFLDEGFGTLDPELLETVVEALEKLHIDKLTVGIISHVPELKARLPRKLVVESAEANGRGSRVIMEGM